MGLPISTGEDTDGRPRCLSHYAFLLQVSVNIGIVLSSVMRRGRPFRAIADLTGSDAKSSARIWYGAPGTTCTAGSAPDLIRWRIVWLVAREAAAASVKVSHSPSFSADR